ncbi:ABC transporter substrate-binding protein [Streptomyces johnsoniae]|uniref:ABC transporter substrate-binding protein n=1 Tax=Streptomyces johnsoniae TaxID=3075532 RepID=A0ABU2S502_9ACTN|nr:ABC transporter substrate-binding protein [Streptomyces sp. DSM 41886]MDT0443150.1 ABC transporter substrate-binding protein [Streptomyces sp. DSM 41886]
MSIHTLRRGRTAGVSIALAGALLLGACSGGGGGGAEDGENGEERSAPEELTSISFGDEAASTGPAEEVPDAQPGGTVNVFEDIPPDHLDPAQIYVQHEQNIARLVHRGLTAVKLDNDGNYTVVGDLATDSGQVSEDGLTWTYTLKDDIFFADGTPITSADIRHTFERQFAPFITQGPTYIQQWLADADGTDYRELLPEGPYNGDHLPDSVLETPDERTVVFHFAQPQNDLPYALSIAGYAVVSEEHDTREAYDQEPMTSGPYRIEEHRPGRSMTLTRNEHWVPETDPTRNAYPDAFEISFGHSQEDSTARLMADNGENRNGISFSNGLDPGNGPTVMEDPQYRERLVDGYQSYVWSLAINMDTVTDERVRQAIAYALPLNGILNAYGGSIGGQYTASMISPLLPGYQPDYDPFGKVANPQGDAERARELLEEADAVGFELSFVHHTAAEDQQAAVAIADALETAGFEVNRSEVPPETYYDTIGVVDGGYDIYRSSWGHDWLSAGTVIPPLFDGRQIQDGASNYSHLNDEHVNAEIDRIRGIEDAAEAAAAWVELDAYIQEELVAAVPAFAYRQTIMHGSMIGGAVFNDDFGTVDMRRIYVIQDES